MNNELIIGSILILILVVAIYLYFWQKERKGLKNISITTSPTENLHSMPSSQQKIVSNPNLLPLQLQAYERLVILTERIALPNLISRLLPEDLDAKNYVALLTNQIRSEYDYNLSQQLYVTSEAWQAITGLRDQNLFILNQILSGQKPDATAKEFVQLVQELLNTDSHVSLHSIVLEALQFDVKKLMTQSS
ncbi:MAG: hypothetical protein ACO29O_07250 [Chitinophagaceae bacterium]